MIKKLDRSRDYSSSFPVIEHQQDGCIFDQHGKFIKIVNEARYQETLPPEPEVVESAPEPEEEGTGKDTVWTDEEDSTADPEPPKLGRGRKPKGRIKIGT